MALLEVDELYAGYGEGDVLHGVSLAVDEGDVVALMGRNGVGKTTTLRAIVGLINPRAGTVRFAGEEITGWEPYEAYAKGISLVPENRGIFPDLSVEENLRVPKVETGRERSVEEIFDLFEALDELRDSKGKHLSGGEQQMLAIGRAFRQDPKLLLLDEVSEGLAPQIVEDVGAAVRNVSEQGTTILMVEQNVEFAFDIASYAYVMDIGEIVLDGTVADLQEDDETLETYLGVHETA